MGATVGRTVGAGLPLVRACVPATVAVARGVAVAEGDGVGGVVGASVRNGAGATVSSGVGSGVCSLFATGGCNGAFGFLGCASAYVVDPSIESPATTTATRRSAQAGTRYTLTAGMRS